MIDTHSHIYTEEFDADRTEVILRARQAGVDKIILPNIDSESLSRMLALEAQYPDYCYAAIGLHPTSVKADFQDELGFVKKELENRQFIAIGEIGMDLYWDKTFIEEQKKALHQQIEWALEYNLPVILHVRDAFDETMEVISHYENTNLRGVFHSFTGTEEQAAQILQLQSFYIGINGVVTFKNSDLKTVLKTVPLSKILTETDAPYLSPVPYRGKRNESAYVKLVAEKLAEIYDLPLGEILSETSRNSCELFNFNV